jgi:hypothetical protein
MNLDIGQFITFLRAAAVREIDERAIFATTDLFHC